MRGNKRWLSIILSVAMVIAMFPLTAGPSIAEPVTKILFLTENSGNDYKDFENWVPNQGYPMDLLDPHDYMKSSGFNNDDLAKYDVIIIDRGLNKNRDFNGKYDQMVNYLKGTEQVVVTAMPKLLESLSMVYDASSKTTWRYRENQMTATSLKTSDLLSGMIPNSNNFFIYDDLESSLTISSVPSNGQLLNMLKITSKDKSNRLMNTVMAVYEPGDLLADGSRANGVRIFMQLRRNNFINYYNTNGENIYLNIFKKYASGYQVKVESEEHGTIISQKLYDLENPSTIVATVSVDEGYKVIRWEKRTSSGVENLSSTNSISVSVSEDTTLTAIIGLENVPTVTDIAVLEVQPFYDATNTSNTHELNTEMLQNAFSKYHISPNITLDQMSIEGFITNIDQLNGKYDLVYIGNKPYYKNGDPRYSFIGAPNSGDDITYFAQGDSGERTPGLPEKAPFNSLYDGNSSETYSAKDISNIRANTLKAFIEAGFMVAFDRDILTTEYQNTKLYQNFNMINKPNFLRVDDATSMIESFSENVVLSQFPIRDQIIINDSPLAYVSPNGQPQYQTIVGDKTLVYNFTVNSVNNDPKNVNVFLDVNGDGIFKNEERYINTEILSPENMTVTYKLPSHYTGFLPWKLEVENIITGAKSYEIGYTAYKAASAGEGVPDIKVLQLYPDEKTNLLDLNNLGSLLHQEGLYDIEIDTMGMNAFNQRFKDGNPVILNGVYDMILIGFADSVSEGGKIDHPDALEAINQFVDSGQSMMLTHDMFHFYVGKAEWSGYYTFGKEFRDKFGQNIYQYDAVKFPNAVDAVIDNEFNEAKAVVPDGSNRIAGFSDGIITRANNRNMYVTDEAFRTNVGQITMYPFIRPTLLDVADTHSQYYQLDMENPDLITWYTLYGNSNDHQDGQNFYYIYSLDNITYSGTGHSKPGGIEEQKLFVNTMVKAAASANHGPDISLYNIFNGKEYYKTDDAFTFGIQARDFDLDDQYLDLKVFVSKNDTNVFELVKHIDVNSKAFESGKYVDLTIAKDASFNTNVNEFDVKIVVADAKGASSERLIEDLLNTGDMGLDLAANWSSNGIVLGEDNAFNITISPRESLTNDTGDFTGIQLSVRTKNENLLLFDEDASFDPSVWSRSMIGDDIEFNAMMGDILYRNGSYEWSKDPMTGNINLSIPVKFLDVDMAGIDFDAEIHYDKTLLSGIVKRDHIMDMDNYVKIVPGVINATVLDKRGRPIPNTDVIVNGPVKQWGGRTNNSGIVSFNLDEGQGPYQVVVGIPEGDYTSLQINNGPDHLTQVSEMFTLTVDNYNQDANVRVLYESIDNIVFSGQIEVVTVDSIIQNDVTALLPISFDVGREANSLTINLSDNVSIDLGMTYAMLTDLLPSNMIVSVDPSGKSFTLRGMGGTLSPGNYEMKLPVNIPSGNTFSDASYQITLDHIVIEETPIGDEDPVVENYPANKVVNIVAIELGNNPPPGGGDNPPPSPDQQKFAMTFNDYATGVIEEKGNGILAIDILPAENVDLNNVTVSFDLANPNIQMEIVEVVNADGLDISIDGMTITIAHIDSMNDIDRTYHVHLMIEVTGATLGEDFVVMFDEVMGVTITSEMLVPEKQVDVIEALKLD